MMHRKAILFSTLTLCVVGQHLCPVHAQESASPPTPSEKGVVADIAKLPRLAVTTAGIANSIIRTRDPQDRESRVNRTYVQNYTSSLAVSADGFLYTDTTWEEGHRPAGTYHEGDALPDHPEFGAGTGDAVAVSDRLVAYGQTGSIVLFSREPGQAFDGKGGAASRREITITPSIGKARISALAIDEKGGRLWFATAEDGAVRCVGLDGKVVATLGAAVPNAGALALDHTGAVWVTQREQPEKLMPVTGAVFSSDAAGGHAAEFALSIDDKKWFSAAKTNGFIGLEFSSPQRVVGLRFTGADKGEFIGGKVQVSTVGRDGPWTDAGKIEADPAGWPDCWMTLPSEPAVRAVRLTSPQVSLRNLTVFTRQASIPGRVLRFSATGQPLPQTITEIAAPGGLFADHAHQRLLVVDAGAAHQVRAYRDLNGKPALDPSFGTRGLFGIAGGVYAGRGGEIGRIGEQRFDGLRGVGLDAVGNIYVAMVGGTGLNQTRFESYTPDGKLRWRLAGLSFIDAADIDPDDETSLWSASSHFALDYGQPAGDEWSHLAATIDTHRFPQDGRFHGFANQTFGMRRIHGKLFLFTTVQVGEFGVYRFDTEKHGHIAIPSGLISTRHTGRDWPAWQPAGRAGFIWRDADGDGNYAANEYQKDAHGGVWLSSWIDDHGNYWGFDLKTQTVQRLSVGAKLDAHGNPVWSYESASNLRYPVPAPFADGTLRGIRVADGDGAVYLVGFTKELTNRLGGNVPLGRVLVRYAQRDGALVETARTELPYDVHFGTDWVKETRDQSAAISLAGDYVFVAYQRTMNTLVYRADTLAAVGRIDVGSQVHVPLIDGPAEMIARKRTKADEYLLFYPMYVGNATTMVRWRPSALAALSVPVGFERKEDQLVWQPVAGAAGYRIERKDLGPVGWSGWNAAGETKETRWPDATLPSGKGHAWRVRAVGPTESDWTHTITQRAGPKVP